jgi:hypothetical protein
MARMNPSLSAIFKKPAHVAGFFNGAPGMARSALALFDSLWW